MNTGRPLADALRPSHLDEIAGQAHLLGPGKPLRTAIDNGAVHSMLLWGPPGTGKTTLARIAAAASNAQFLSVSAVLAGVKDIRQAIAQAEHQRAGDGGHTVLFVDEVHRFNKSQQDAFLPHVESGLLTFIGATTENPSFEVNSALLSRARVYVLRALTQQDVVQVLERAVGFLSEEAAGLELEVGVLELLADAADGDARRALNFLEIAVALATGDDRSVLSCAAAQEVLSGGSTRRFDKGGEHFYDQISALHKSIRGSAPDAALYWLCRMLDGGCDPRYIARRLVRVASEDIGNADPRALTLALDSAEAYERLGTPEGELALAQATVYLACAAKSNAVYAAVGAASEEVKSSGSLPVPLHLRNAPTRLMKALDYGQAYRYAHDEPEAYAAGENYFPEGLEQRRYYAPAPRGLEIRIGEKLERLRALDRASGSRSTSLASPSSRRSNEDDA